jgi:cytoskeletal protein RodZ
MGTWRRSGQCLAVGALAAFAMQAAVQLAVAQATNTSEPAQAVASSAQQPVAELPDSPGATVARMQSPSFQQSSSQQGSSAQSSNVPASAESQGQPTQSAPAQTQPAQRPVGTAAAEPMHAGGVAASQPAGVAVAPAKQRRTRTIVIRVGAIIGAGVAVGTVAALTQATSSKPPGAH